MPSKIKQPSSLRVNSTGLPSSAGLMGTADLDRALAAPADMPVYASQPVQSPQPDQALQPAQADQKGQLQPAQQTPQAIGGPAQANTEATLFQVPKILRKDLGIKVRYPTNKKDLEDIEVDILAIHGIGAHPEKTWTYSHRDPHDDSEMTKKVNWLSDEELLPKAFPKARIMTFGYDSVWYGEAPPRQSMNGIAKKVLEGLNEERKSCPNRPIIMVGHCFGGLIIEQAYLHAKTLSFDYPGIYSSVIGMIFLGTPHRGSDLANSETLDKFYGLIAKTQTFVVQDDLLKTIAQDNTILMDTVHDFTRDLNTRTPPPKVFCFFEERPTPVGRIAGIENTPREFMVNEASGSLHGHKKMGWTVDHFEMNKFEDAEDRYYRDVVGQIQNMLDASEDIMKEREDQCVLKDWKLTGAS